MKAFSVETRTQNIEAFKQKTFDVVIIGGGITGAGAARDAASRGMSVALVESRDFAEGTSSRSSKLIHGGIRYLENLEFHLVFEALSERTRLFEIAPFLVHPLRFILPVYKGDKYGMFQMGLGMMLYDALALFDTPEGHARLNVEECLEKAPFLENRNLKGAYIYSDAYMDDDRLVTETLRSANEFGAVCANYVSATGAVMTNGKISAIKCRDEIYKKEFSIQARQVISTVGPWTDEFGSTLFSDWKKVLRPSKGIHITLNRDRLPLKDAVVMVSADQKRIVFAIPRHEMIIIGTTDTDFKNSPQDVHSDEADVKYLLNIVDEHFPNAKITAKDIMASYSGVRPLVHDGSESESKTSREHLIFYDERGVTFVAGGKYTTYRRMAEETVDKVIKKFPLEAQMKFSRSKTLAPLNPKATAESLQLLGRLIPAWSEQFGVDPGLVRQLAERHGEETEDILRCGSKLPGISSDLWALEAVHAIENTMCVHLKDFYLRRVPLFLARFDHGFSLLETLADVFCKQLGWDSSRRSQEIQAVKDHLNFEMAWQKSMKLDSNI